MKFYGKKDKRIQINDILNANVGTHLRKILEEKRSNDAYEDFIKLASYHQINLKFGEVEEALKTLALSGCNDALAYYLFNAETLDYKVRKYVELIEEHGNKNNPEILKIIAGLHLHDIVEFENEFMTVKKLIKNMEINSHSLYIMTSTLESWGINSVQIENIKTSQNNAEKLFNNTPYAKHLYDAQNAYLNEYKNSKNPLDAFEFLNLRHDVSGALKIKYPKNSNQTLTFLNKNDKETTIHNSYDLKIKLIKMLNRSLKNSEVSGEYYLPYAYAYSSIANKDIYSFSLHAKNILKQISKLPLKTAEIKIKPKNKTKQNDLNVINKN